ncbi:MAG: transporter substrate-binding domain-containing protein [Candidatus Moranbacteria bacterium]|nr:transporter substrate-binding domain-containing protein [Candidatus Moranbacteria bacterium]
MLKTRKIGGMAALALAALMLAGCGAKPAPDAQKGSPASSGDASSANQTETAPVQNSFDAAKTYVVSGHPEWPPIMWRSGDKIVGAGPQLVEKIAGDLGFKVESKYMGLWDEVQAKAKSGEIDMLAAAYKTAERETYMDYSDAYTTDPIALFVKKGKTFSYAKWDDLVGKKGVATVGDSYGQEFDDFIKAKLAVDRVETVDEAFAALANGKADYFIYALYGGQKVLNDKKTSGQFEALPKYAAEENFYVTISKKSPLVKFLPQINELIQKYKSDGTIDRLIRENKKISLGI